MKKSNGIIMALCVAASAFLLWLWYFLGFNRVDQPLDVVLSVGWWVLIAGGMALIVRMETVRRRRVRTVYVGQRATFNSEKGLMSFAADTPTQDAIASVVAHLKYNFACADYPQQDAFQARYFVRTREFAGGESAQDAPGVQGGASAAVPERRTWRGEVVVAQTREERRFETPEELTSILATLDA